jgi:hypothetical protein
MQQNDQISTQELLRQQKEIEALNAGWQRKFAEAKQALSLRQWCVEAAVKGGGNGLMSYKSIHQFVTAAYDLPDESLS